MIFTAIATLTNGDHFSFPVEAEDQELAYDVADGKVTSKDMLTGALSGTFPSASHAYTTRLDIDHVVGIFIRHEKKED